MPQRRLNVKAVIGQGQGGRIYIQYVQVCFCLYRPAPGYCYPQNSEAP